MMATSSDRVLNPVTATKLVLLVEDDPDIRESIQELLQGVGYRVALACDGQEAIRFLEGSAPPCLILLDLMMPVMDGWQFCAERRKVPEWARIPVIVLSAGGDVRDKAVAVGAVDFLRKPPDVDDLLDAVERVCGLAESGVSPPGESLDDDEDGKDPEAY